MPHTRSPPPRSTPLRQSSPRTPAPHRAAPAVGPATASPAAPSASPSTQVAFPYNTSVVRCCDDQLNSPRLPPSLWRIVRRWLLVIPAFAQSRPIGAAIPWVSGRSRAAPWARAPARLLAPHRAAIRASAPLIGGVAGVSLRDYVNTECLRSRPVFATEESLQKGERSRDDPCEPPVCPARLPARRRSVTDGRPLRPDCATRPRRYQPSARRVYQPA